MPKTDLTQQYAHYHQKWTREQNRITAIQSSLSYVAQGRHDTLLTRELALAKRRATYANNKMCALEALSQAQGNGIGSLTWFPTVQDGYITPSMYQG